MFVFRYLHTPIYPSCENPLILSTGVVKFVILSTYMSSLFPYNVPFCETEDELNIVKEQFKEHQLDEYFLVSAAIKERKDFFDNLFKTYEPYADNGFLKDAQIQFHQRSWEMYLGAILLRNNKRLLQPTKHDNKIGTADIRISSKKVIHIECVATNHGDKNDKVPKLIPDPITNIVLRDVPSEKILIRIANSLDKKFKQYEDRLKKGVVKDDEPYVIAISVGKLDYLEEFPRVIQATLAVGHLQLKMYENGIRLDKPIPSRQFRPTVFKENGQPVDMQFFLRPEHCGISAIIFTNDLVLNYQEQEKELFILHNHLAKNPISLSEFNFLVQYHKDTLSDELLTTNPNLTP